MTRTDELTRELVDAIDDIFGEQWAVIVLDDDVTTFETVIGALMEIFGHSHKAAEALAWKVHREGRAEVFIGPRDEARSGVKALQRRQIRAVTERA